MSTQAAATSVRHEIVVRAPVARAFELFTTRFDRIKPREHNIMAADIEETVLEPRLDGRIYDRAVDGTTCEWGRILAFDPPERLVFAWQIGPTWELEADPANASEVEVRFVPEGAGTRVVLEHRHLDRHGSGWESVRDGVDAPQGWPLYLQRFGDVAAEG
jgi:uncharacterized protein YndB with AHSA1/START domain